MTTRNLSFFFRIGLIVFVASALSACSDSPLEKAEKSLIDVHRELKSRIDSRDGTLSGIRYSFNKLNENRNLSAIAQYHEGAKAGNAGTTEQLIVAKKMLDDPLYERKLMDKYSASKQDTLDTLEHIKWLEEKLPKERERLREFLPTAKAALAKYESALQAETLSHGKKPPTSYNTDAIVREIKKELEDDVRRTYFEKIELEKKELSTKR